MKIMYQGVFSREELMSYRPAIYYHVLSSAQAIIKAMLRIGIDFQRPENKVSGTFFIFPYFFSKFVRIGRELQKQLWTIG